MTAAAPLDIDVPEPASERPTFARPRQPDDPWALRLHGVPRDQGPTLEALMERCEAACASIGATGERGTVSYPGRPRHDDAPLPDWGSYAGGRPEDDPAWRQE